MRRISLLLFICLFTSCVNDLDNAPYPHSINTHGSWMIRYSSENDSLTLAMIKRAGISWMGRSNVTEVDCFGPELFYISFEKNGDISYAYQSDKSWITLPLLSRKPIQNPERTVSDGLETYHTTESVSSLVGVDTMVRHGKRSLVYVSTVSSVRRWFTSEDKEYKSIAWTDSLWWSSYFGFFSQGSQHYFTPELKKFDFVTDFVDSIIRI